jgi:hypothetical protein
MSARTTIELMPLLSSLLVAAPAWALEPCYAIGPALLRCGHDEVIVRGVRPVAPRSDGTTDTELLQRVVSSGRVRIQARSMDRNGRLLADVYVNEVLIRQRQIGPRAKCAPKGSYWTPTLGKWPTHPKAKRYGFTGGRSTASLKRSRC